MRSRQFTSAIGALLLTAAAAGAQTVASPAEGTASFTIFAGSTPIGTEEITVAKIGSGWRISSTGSQRAPAQLVINEFNLTLAPDWHPRELRIEALLRDQPISSTTTFGITTAVTDYLQNGRRASVSHQISARTIALPNAFYAAYEALAVRLGSTAPGSALKIFVVPQAEIDAIVKSVSDHRITTTTSGTVSLRRYELAIVNAGGELPIVVDVDAGNRLARVVIPGAGLSVVRDDLSSVATRSETHRNPGDEDVFVPSLGFNLASTLTRPPGAAGKLPAVVLVGSAGPLDRDELVGGVPLFGQLAGELAKAGYLVLRYDKRGVGQSGGRPEAATLADYAEDARAAVNWLAKRRDVDKDRIALVGFREGAAVALLAASREKKIKALALISGPGTTGYDLILEQQRLALDRMKLEPAEREARIAMQRRILDAVMSGKGWEGIDVNMRAAADTPWFRSLLGFDPARLMTKVRQPLLVLRVENDAQVPPHHAERLAGFANARRKSMATNVATIRELSSTALMGGVIDPFLKYVFALR